MTRSLISNKVTDSHAWWVGGGGAPLLCTYRNSPLSSIDSKTTHMQAFLTLMQTTRNYYDFWGKIYFCPIKTHLPPGSVIVDIHHGSGIFNSFVSGVDKFTSVFSTIVYVITTPTPQEFTPFICRCTRLTGVTFTVI